MQQLTRTLLSKRPTQTEILFGVISFMILVMIHVLDHEAMVASFQQVFEQKEYWRAFTTSLVHADFTHLGHNAFFFTIFAVLLKTYFGWVMFPLVSFLMGGVINLITLSYYGPGVHLVGVSGVVYFMVAVWMTLYVCIDRKNTFKRRLMTAVAVSLALFFPQVFEARTSYMAHAVGFLSGIILGIFYFSINRHKIRSHEVWVETVPDPEIIEVEEYALNVDASQDNLER